jgi:hypothetical protein
VTVAALAAASCNRSSPSATSLPADLRQSADVLNQFLQARKEGRPGTELWRAPASGPARLPANLPVNPARWERGLSRDASNTPGTHDARWAWHRVRVWSTMSDGATMERVWDFCLNSTPAGYRLVDAWPASNETTSLCSESPRAPRFNYGKSDAERNYESRFKVIMGFAETFRPECREACKDPGATRACDACICEAHKISAADCDQRARAADASAPR